MGRSPCCDENSNLKKGPWTPEEDQMLTDYIHKHGHGSWRALPKLAGLRRCGKSCRLRWTNYLRPDIKRGKFSKEEENNILHLHSILGNKWSTIAAHLPGRTDNEIKNYWNTHLKKRLIQMGIDPMTHQPKTDLFSCFPQLIALANLKELLQHTQLTHNLHYLNLLRQQGVTNANPQLESNLMPAANQELINLYNFSKELGQERVEMSTTLNFPVENITSPVGGGSQPLQEEAATFMNNIIIPTNDQDNDDEVVVDHCQMGLMTDKSSSSTWNPLPSLIHDTSGRGSNNTTNSQEHCSSTVSYGGGPAGSTCGGGPGAVSSFKDWQDFLFEDSFLDENLKQIC